MSFFIKQKLYIYKKYKLDIWGVVRNSFTIKEQWKNFNYKKLLNRYQMYKKARIYNSRRTLYKKQDTLFGKRLDIKFIYKIKIYRNLIKIVFRLKPSKKLNKICLFFFNRKRRKRNIDWWKKKIFIYEVRDLYIKKKKKKKKKKF